MKRRSFLQFLGLAPAAAVAPAVKASEKFVETASRLNLPAMEVPIVPFVFYEATATAFGNESATWSGSIEWKK